VKGEGMKTMTQPVAGWYRDPSKRHDHRWWDGTAWTPHVMTLGLASVDYGDEPASDLAEGAVEPPEPTADVEVEVEVEPSASRWPAAVWCTALLGAGLLVVGAVLPWAEASSDQASFSSMGIDGNGGATLAAALAIALLCAIGRRRKLAAGLMIGVAALAGAIGAHDALDISDKADRLMQQVPTVSASVGIGVWVTLAGAAIALAGGLIAFVAAARSPRA
jgi:hypothetical protein